ncbi:MAG: class I SAM-dependent methyltransferase [Cellvibrio sp.]|uniref:class I SAM-dependent methyltransferase n=1 Tax=Cellvibrio sp. TaxID=1965322 RepID=UPI0031A5FAA7
MPNSIAVLCNYPPLLSQAEALANLLQLSLLTDQSPDAIDAAEFVVLFTQESIQLQQTGRKAPGPVIAEFTEGAVDHRRKFGGGKGQMIAKAVGIKAGVYPQVLDATAGLGKDSFVLASLGCTVTMLERSPIVQTLLADGLARAQIFARDQDAELLQTINRMQLLTQDSRRYLESLSPDQFPDVIYLDPMFPERHKTADVKKEMAAFHQIVGKDEDADALLPLALAHVNYRVVVKRPRKAPLLNNQTPSYQLEGKSSRYDIYTIKKLPDALPAAR